MSQRPSEADAHRDTNRGPRFCDGQAWVALTAGWRDDAVHTQVFHQLSVVIERVGYGVDCESEARALPRARGACDWCYQVLLVDRGHGFVERCERSLQIVHDFGFGFYGVRALLV